jgi:hypothetical protein
MNEKNLIHRNDKKHRKLVRSPDRLSPCEAENAILSHSLNILSPSSHVTSPSSNMVYPLKPSPQPPKSSDDCLRNYENYINSLYQLPPTASQQAPHIVEQYSNQAVVSLVPSASAPSIALYRKPSITISNSKSIEQQHSSFNITQLQSRQSTNLLADTNQQKITKMISSEQMDQKCNNFLKNFNSIPTCCLKNANIPPADSTQQIQQQSIKNNLNFQNPNQKKGVGYGVQDTKRSMSPTALGTTTNPTAVISSTSDIYRNVFNHSPTSQSLNLNLINQTDDNELNLNKKLIFNSNNPFLNDNFDEPVDTNCQNNKQCIDNFFKLDDESGDNYNYASNQCGIAQPIGLTPYIQTARSLGEDESQNKLKNKREQFSNTSMKICLVVSPPTNKFLQVSRHMFLIVFFLGLHVNIDVSKKRVGDSKN